MVDAPLDSEMWKVRILRSAPIAINLGEGPEKTVWQVTDH